MMSFFKEPKRKKERARRAYLINALDDLVSKRVRERDGNTCRKVCGSTIVFPHHIFGKKAHPSTRWDVENCLSLCTVCHAGAHANPLEFKEWVISWMGEKDFEDLYVRAQKRTSFKMVDLERLLKEMRK